MAEATAEHRGLVAVIAMNKQHSRRAFNSWQSVWEERKAVIDAMRSGLNRLLNTQLAQAWSAWYESVRSSQASAKLLGSGLNRLLNQKLSKAWDVWEEMADTRAEKLRVLRQGLQHITHRNLARCFAAWLRRRWSVVSTCVWPEAR